MQIVIIIFNIWILSISYFVVQVLSFANNNVLNLNLNFSFELTHSIWLLLILTVEFTFVSFYKF